ncbi:hypothetical protein AJ79_04812 [Helicocarpus griseus UAMH5409]|uniref:Rhodopsin domain-containing protein n=1 Tax=Helicocarpus griseus UAMH5409 TaxID=1447875 RepID=A0A2B7XIK0_9EURO|nr:hypothetical protein AJ79_04812 [Helicocarpus griseus UAMH5409]
MGHTVKPAGDGLILLIVTILMLVISYLTVIARLFVRHLIKQSGSDDWLMVVGLVFFTVCSGLIITFIYHGGGYSSADISFETNMLGTKFYFVAQVFYSMSTIPIKCSIAATLLRIAGTRKHFRYILYGIIGLAVASGIITTIAIINVCKPPAALWKEVDGVCDNTLNANIGFFLSASGIVTDWTLAILPAWLLWDVRLKRRIKVTVAFILALGAFASCATIVRLRYLLLYNDPQEFVLNSARIAVWSILELGIGIFAGSLGHLRPLLRYIPFLPQSSYAAQTYGRNNVDRSGTKMNTFRSRTGQNTAAMGKTDEELYGAMKGSDDGDSQKHILGDGREEGIRKVTEVTVSGYDRYEGGMNNNSQEVLGKNQTWRGGL